VLLLAGEGTAISGLKGAGKGALNRGDNQGQVVLEDLPFNGRQRDDSNGAPFEVLFIGERSVAG
jgi:hypothetical protein